MTSANLQLQEVFVVLAELIAQLEVKGMLTQGEIADLLARAEQRAGRDAEARPGASGVDIDTVLLPIRLLMETQLDSARSAGFSALARRIGENKPPRPGVVTADESHALAVETERARDA